MTANHQPLDPNLVEYCTTARQIEMFNGIQQLGSSHAFAQSEGIASTNVQRFVRQLKARAAQKGYAPEHQIDHTVPDGYKIKGVSTMERVHPDGSRSPIIQWTKTNEDAERQVEILAEVLQAMAEDIEPLRALPPPVTSRDKDLLNVYTMTDTHIGMLAWGKECGKDWDLEIAENTLTGCFADMLRRSPDADECVIAQLGDWLHYDSLTPETPTSGHALDADSRAGKMVSVACRVLERLVDMALAKHNKVKLLIAEGNHDLYGSLWLRTMFRRLYQNDPRVEIIESENPYYAMRFGVTMLGWHHGHKRRPGMGLAEVFSSMYRKMWGEAEHCVIHTGDLHHKSEKEHAGFSLLQHGTLAANDAYAIRGGWRSDQYAEAITYHKEFGEAGRVRTTPTMVGL